MKHRLFVPVLFIIASLLSAAALLAQPGRALASDSAAAAQSDSPASQPQPPTASTPVSNGTGAKKMRPATSAQSTTSKPNARTPRGGAVARKDAPALRVLDMRVDAVAWIDEPLEFVMDWLREQGQINVVVVWRSLAPLAIDRETPVSLELRDVTLHALLAELCEQLSPNGEVRFRGHGNMIKFATRAHFDRVLYTRVYDVTDLIFTQDEFGAPDIIGVGGAASMDGGSGGPIDTYTLPEVRQVELEDMIRHIVSPDRWVENGGDWSFRVWRNSLIVRAPLSVHQQIAGEFYLP